VELDESVQEGEVYLEGRTNLPRPSFAASARKRDGGAGPDRDPVSEHIVPHFLKAFVVSFIQVRPVSGGQRCLLRQGHVVDLHVQGDFMCLVADFHARSVAMQPWFCACAFHSEPDQSGFPGGDRLR